jgi:hypothetical protein
VNSVTPRSDHATWIEPPRSVEELREIIAREWRKAAVSIRCCAVCKQPLNGTQPAFRGTLRTTRGLILAKFCAPCHERLTRYPLASEAFTRQVLALLDKFRRGP